MNLIVDILRVAGVLLCVAAFVYWMVSFIKWDGKCHCDPGDCETCPFPHEGREGYSKNRRNP